MTFKTDMTSDLSVIFDTDEFAESIDYTPKDDWERTIPAIVDRTASSQEPYVRDEDTATCDITVKASDVTTPQQGDTFYIDEQTWEMSPELGVVYKDDRVLIIALRRRD